MHSLYLVGPIYVGILLIVLVVIFGPVLAIVAVVIYLARRGRTLAAPTQFSGDNKWFWDGQQWRSAMSEDGLWRWDGRDWKPVVTGLP